MLKEIEEAQQAGREAARLGKSARHNPYLGGPSYVADAWWAALVKEAVTQRERGGEGE